MARKRPPSKPKQWAAAVEKVTAARSAMEEGLEELKSLKEEYDAQYDNLSDGFRNTARGEKLEAINGLDLDPDFSWIDDLENIEVPLGFGRD